MAYAEYITAGNETRTIRDLNGQQMLATIEASTTASKAYAVGDYLIINDKVYKVTVAIASGGTITVGTNVTETKVGAELTDLNRQISESITPAIEEIETALDGKAPVIINTASGDIASFADGADGMPVKSLVANIEPVQDLHGYDNPWPEGGGKNLLPLTDESIKTASGVTWSGDSLTFNGVTWTINKDTGGNVIGITANGTPSTGGSQIVIARLDIAPGAYTFSGITDGSGATWYTRYVARDANGTAISVDGSIFIDVYTIETTKTLPSNVSFINAYVGTRVAISNKTFKPMIRLSTEADATFAPYSNICPISGWTGANGQNTENAQQWDEEWEVGALSVSDGSLLNVGSHMRSKNYIPVASGKTYYRAGVYMSDGRAFFYGQDKSFISHAPISSAGAFDIPYNACFMKFHKYGASYSNDISINYPSTDTEYHPYTGSTLSITFPSSAGTVYGGTLDVTNGVLTVDRAMVDLGTLTWAKAASSNYKTFFGDLSNTRYLYAETTVMLSAYVGTNGQAASASADNYVWVDSRSSISIKDTSKANMSASEFKTAVSGVQLVYELATPQTYQLTESEISGILETLYGTNNIWTDVGTVDVEYPADTKLYIEQLTKPTEDDMTADHAISAGTFFMIGNNLYLATSQIAAGGTITPGTNATQLSLADALNQLNT